MSSICLAILFYNHIHSQAVYILSDYLTKNYSYNGKRRDRKRK